MDYGSSTDAMMQDMSQQGGQQQPQHDCGQSSLQGITASHVLPVAAPMFDHVANYPVIASCHHHHVYMWSPQDLSLNPIMPPSTSLSHSNLDYSHHHHISRHHVSYFPTQVILSKKLKDLYHRNPSSHNIINSGSDNIIKSTMIAPHLPLNVVVTSSVAGTTSSVHCEKDHLHFRHEFVHYHRIYCKEIWPSAPAPRLCVTKCSIITFTKTFTARLRRGNVLAQFHHDHTHYHTLRLTLEIHPGFEAFFPPTL